MFYFRVTLSKFALLGVSACEWFDFLRHKMSVSFGLAAHSRVGLQSDLCTCKYCATATDYYLL